MEILAKELFFPLFESKLVVNLRLNEKPSSRVPLKSMKHNSKLSFYPLTISATKTVQEYKTLILNKTSKTKMENENWGREIEVRTEMGI